MALAIIGVYGVVSMALGAGRAQVIRLVLSGALRPLVAGLVAGAAGSMLAGGCFERCFTT